MGRILSKKLDMPFYDSELLLIAAERYGFSPDLLRDRDEKRIDGLLYNLSILAGDVVNPNKMSQPYEIFQAQCDTIRKLACENPCIFIGRCANYALKEVCKTVNVFLYASSMEERRKRAHEIDSIDLKNIDTYIKKKDMERRCYHNFFAEKDWGKLESYDLCLNTSMIGYEACANVIIGLMDQ